MELTLLPNALKLVLVTTLSAMSTFLSDKGFFSPNQSIYCVSVCVCAYHSIPIEVRHTEKATSLPPLCGFFRPKLRLSSWVGSAFTC